MSSAPLHRWPRTRRAALLAALVLASLAPAARAGELVLRDDGSGPLDRYSVGFMLGEPSGLAVEKNLRNGNAWDAGLGVIYGPGLRLHGDYKWTVGTLETNSDLYVRFQIGAGGLIGSLTSPCEFYGSFGCDGGLYVGARVPFDIELWTQAPINFGLEIAPVLAVSGAGLGGFLDAFVFLRFVL